MMGAMRRTALLVFAGWTFIAFYFAVQAYFNPAYNPRPGWSHVVYVNFTYYYLWALCTPLVVFPVSYFFLGNDEGINVRTLLGAALTLSGIGLIVLH